MKWYDPWDSFGESKARTIGRAPFADQPIYHSLVNLVAQFPEGRVPTGHPETQKLILQWCQQYGPLGVLLSQWEAICLAPLPDEDGRLWQQTYSRGFGNVTQSMKVPVDRGGPKPSSALLRPLNELHLLDERPDKTLGRFFPAIARIERNSYQYPDPYSDEFCSQYAEPLGLFCEAAILLVGAIRQFGRKIPLTSEAREARSEAMYTLNVLRKPIDSVLDFDENDQPILRWTSPSLLASFAEMFVQDLLYGRALLLCLECNGPFFSDAYQALYCSKPCCLRYQKRRLRQQMKDAHQLRSEGKGVRQIATALGQEVGIVKGWLQKTPTQTRRNARLSRK
jgi:hypothetical protein